MFFIVSQETGIGIFMQIVGDNLYELSDPVDWKKWDTNQFVVCWICPESGKGYFFY